MWMRVARFASAVRRCWKAGLPKKPVRGIVVHRVVADAVGIVVAVTVVVVVIAAAIAVVAVVAAMVAIVAAEIVVVRAGTKPRAKRGFRLFTNFVRASGQPEGCPYIRDVFA